MASRGWALIPVTIVTRIILTRIAQMITKIAPHLLTASLLNRTTSTFLGYLMP